MRLSKAPKVLREIRIAYIIPELRSLVVQNIGLHFVRLSYATVFFVPALMIAIIGKALTNIGESMEKHVDTILAPCRWLKKRELKNRESGHSIVSVEEIRRRVYGENSATGEKL